MNEFDAAETEEFNARAETESVQHFLQDLSAETTQTSANVESLTSGLVDDNLSQIANQVASGQPFSVQGLAANPQQNA